MFSTWVTKAQTAIGTGRGAITVEYGLLLMLVLLVAITAVAIYGAGVLELYNDSTNRYSTAVERNLG